MNDTFPVYRKYKGVNTWFKILGADEFIEVKQIGDTLVFHHIHAKKYPEKLFIIDMLNLADDRWEEVSEEEVEKMLKVWNDP